MSGRRFRFSHVLTSATAAVALLACGSSPPPKPAETVQAAPKVEKVVGVPDAAVKAFNAGVTALEQTPPDYAAASGHFDAATQAYPAYDAAWLNLAFCYGKSGRHVDAASAYRKVIAKGNVPRAVQLDFGRALMFSGENDNAITEFESVLRANPEDLGARNNLAAAYQRKGGLPDGLKYVKEVLAVQPKNVPAIINLGLIYLKQKQAAAGRADVQEGDELRREERLRREQPRSGVLRAERRPGAVAEFEKAIGFDPTMDEARLNLAAIYLDYLDYAAALPQFQAVRARFPKHYQAMVGEADALYGTQQFEPAAKVYEESLEIRADNPEVLLRVGKIYEEQLNLPKKALAFYIKYRDVVKPGANDPINATIQFLEQADTLKPQEKAPKLRLQAPRARLRRAPRARLRRARRQRRPARPRPPATQRPPALPHLPAPPRRPPTPEVKPPRRPRPAPPHGDDSK